MAGSVEAVSQLVLLPSVLRNFPLCPVCEGSESPAFASTYDLIAAWPDAVGVAKVGVSVAPRFCGSVSNSFHALPDQTLSVLAEVSYQRSPESLDE